MFKETTVKYNCIPGKITFQEQRRNKGILSETKMSSPDNGTSLKALLHSNKKTIQQKNEPKHS